MTDTDPIAALALSHDVPEAVSHAGRHFITLPIDPSLFKSDAASGIDYALRLNGSTSEIAIDDIPDLGAVTSYTFACWLRPKGQQNSSIFTANARALSENHSNSFALKFDIDRAGPHVYAIHTTKTIVNLGGGRIAPDGWSHIAYVHDADRSSGVLYVNGSASSPQAIPLGTIELVDMHIGVDHGGGALGVPGTANHLRGDLDDATLWDEALQPEQIASLSDQRPISDMPDPVFRFVFNDGPGADRATSRGRIAGIDATIRDASWVFSSRPFVEHPRLDIESVSSAISDAIDHETYDARLFANPAFLTTAEARAQAGRALQRVDRPAAAAAARRGSKLWFYRAEDGSLAFEFRSPPGELIPQIALTESYRLSTFRGAYGPGRIVNTYSLLPGEETQITVGTYSTRTDATDRTSSILDSSSSALAKEFGTAVSNESSQSSTSTESLEWSASAKGEVSGAIWSASAEASASGSTQSAREAMANTVSNVASRRAVEESASRNIQVSTTSSSATTTEQRSESTRTLRNINVGRTLNFVFRQMNQEFISLLHLVDVQVSFRFAGQPDSLRTVPLPQLDQLLEDVLVDDAGRAQARELIRSEIAGIRDHEDVMHPDFLTIAHDGDDDYARVDHRYVSRFVNPATATELSVPGIIIAVTSNVMRTDHVYVDTFIGEGEALDAYSKGLQDEALEKERMQNKLLAERARTEAELRQHRRRAVELALRGDAKGWKLLGALDAADHDHDPST